MRMPKFLLSAASIMFLVACSPVKSVINHEYDINRFGTPHCHPSKKHLSLLISKPEAASIYQTNQMLYVDNPYETRVFAKNAWVAPPSDMLYPLLIESAERANCFRAVAAGDNLEFADYRLDSTILVLHQNFLIKPSVLEMVVKFTVVRGRDGKVMRSKIIKKLIPAPKASPQGGAIAANIASQQLTKEAIQFVMRVTG